jgi:hypothetical protein
VVRTLEGDGQLRVRRHGRSESYGNVWEVIFGFEKLMGNLENLKKHAIELYDAEQFRIGINLAWEKLDKYYNLLDEIPVYYIALALLLEPWHRNCAAAGAGLRSCPATRRCHMTAGGGSENTTTGSC